MVQDLGTLIVRRFTIGCHIVTGPRPDIVVATLLGTDKEVSYQCSELEFNSHKLPALELGPDK